jgi:hypothetical protein
MMNHNQSYATTVTGSELARQEEDWDLQMKAFEEVEQWEKTAKQKLPGDLKVPFLEYLSQYSGIYRMPAYKIMEVLNWDYTKLSQLFAVLKKIPKDLMTPFISLMESFVPPHIEVLFLQLMFEYHDYQVVDLTAKVPRAEVHILLQVCRHLPALELETLKELSLRLPFQHIIGLLIRCDEPMAKGCALCRTRRLHALEQRMLNEQVPANTIRVTGAVPLYEKFDQWAADDEKGFTFNTDTAAIFWYKQPVDLVQICAKCLQDVHQAVTNNGRFKEIFHIEPAKRKELLDEQRAHEASMATVIWKIAHERHHRRAREFALHALELQRFGLKREEDERQKQASLLAHQQRLEAKKQQHAALVQQAVAVDQKWLSFDADFEARRLDLRQLYVETKQREGYDQNNKPSKQRLHERTWELAPITDSGKPVLPKGASQVPFDLFTFFGFSFSFCVFLFPFGVSTGLKCNPAQMLYFVVVSVVSSS